MLRRSLTTIATIAASLGPSVVVFGPPAEARARGRPNVLIIVTDDQRFGTYAVMPSVRHWMLAGGTNFPQAMATTPLCCPSRASIFTGRYAHNHGVTTNASAGWKHLNQFSTIQHYLHRHGYTTAIVGKYFNDWPVKRAPPWFDRWATFSPGDGDSGGYVDTTWNLNGSVRKVAAYSTDFVTDRGERMIRATEKHDARPWLLYLTPFAPHEPATPAPRDADSPVPRFRSNPAVTESDLSDKPRYVRSSDLSLEQTLRLRTAQLRSLRAVDDLVGQVMRTLADTHELGSTLVFLTSDNGFLWEEHGLERKGPPYVQGLRIPMVVRWPRHVAAGASDHRFAATIDIAPTVMAATGTPVPTKRPMDGRSLLEGWQRSPFLAEFWKVHTARPPSWASLRTRTHQYVEYYGPAGAIIFREYYALGPDPWELVNLLHDGVSGNEPNVRRLHRKLHAMRRCEGDRCW